MVTTPTMPLQRDMDIQAIDENVLSSIDIGVMTFDMNHESLTQDSLRLTIHPIMAIHQTSQVILSLSGGLDVFLRHPRNPIFPLLATSELKVLA